MKKSNRLAILAITLVFGMTVVGCDDNSTDNGDGGEVGGDGSLGNTLTITDEQVYTVDATKGTVAQFTGTVENLNYVYGNSGLESINDLIEGSPSVTLINGKLNVSLGTPKNSSLQIIDASTVNPGITVSTTNVKGFTLSRFYNGSDNFNSTAEVYQGLPFAGGGFVVSYVYVNKDVNISGTYLADRGTVIYAMNLKAGWNSAFQTASQTEIILKTGKPPADYKWIISQ